MPSTSLIYRHLLKLIKAHSKIYIHQYGTHIHGLAADCSNSIANALELLQPCAKPLIWSDCKPDIMVAFDQKNVSPEFSPKLAET